MALLSSVSVVLAVGIFMGAAPPDECVLPKVTKVFADGTWTALPLGTKVTIKARGKQWTDVTSDKGSGRVSTPLFDAVCPGPLPGPVAPDAQGAAAAPQPTEPSPPADLSGSPSPGPGRGGVGGEGSVPGESAAPAATTIEPDTLVAISAVRAGPGLEGSAGAVTTVLAAEIGAARGHKAVAPNELKALLAHQADASLLGCETMNCLANVAKLVDAELLATGTLDQVEGAFVLSLSLIEPAGPSVVARQEAVWRGSADEMLALVRPLVARLLDRGDAAAHTGTLEVVAPDGALVVVDGKDRGHAPLAAPVTELATGAHTVQVSLDGHLPFASDVVVARNETTVARVELEEIPLLQRPWFWVATGSAALVAGGAAAGLTAWAVLSQEQSASVVLAPKP